MYNTVYSCKSFSNILYICYASFVTGYHFVLLRT
jgi:hypothetical protein